MPPPPNYNCPVCKKGFQRGHLGRHIITHEKKELIEYVTNTDSVASPNWHPEFDCSGHTYIICPISKEGFEKDKLLHKKHACKNDYSAWLILSPENTIVENTVVVKKAVVDEEPINAIDMVLPEDLPVHKAQCECHNEITRLQNELEELQKWRDLVLQSAPRGSPKPKTPTKEPEKKIKKQEQEPQAPPLPQPQQQQPQPQQQKKSAKPKIQASKKEIEKGMWCVECSACRTIAQFATDLRECCNCKKLSHFNDDLTGCYHWDCTMCSKKSCYSCVKAAGGNKIKPFCSQRCATAHKQSN